MTDSAKDLMLSMLSQHNFDPNDPASVARVLMVMAGMLTALMDRVVELEARL